MRLRFFKDDLGAQIPFAIQEKDSTGTLVGKNLSGLTVSLHFEDRDGNKVTVSGGDIAITDTVNGEGTFTVTAALTAAEKTWTQVQAKVTSGATYIEHSDPIVTRIGPSSA